ncbi:MAG: Crp/Fnr family transcriptional regulator [Ruminococcaceae bacterium]|nr:Crp/Fnr family transcriptional regulator [Oscillospiraceae bacterium]
MKKEYGDFIYELFIFNNLTKATVDNILCSREFEVKEFLKGETIFSPDSFQKKIGFVLNGECRVERLREEGSAVSLNTLCRHDSFGILAVLSSESEYPTKIVASKNASVLFFDGRDLIAMIKENPQISLNVISFLTSRIAFLNKKIATFSGKSTLQKLASYLLTKGHENGGVIKICRTKLSAELGVGRASVYRDLDILEAKDLIEIKQKEIIIKCPEGLERI